MQIPVLARRGQVKPYGSIPRINPSHPLARGLVFYGYDVGGQAIDLVGGSVATHSGQTVPSGTSKFGSGIKYPGPGVNGETTWPKANLPALAKCYPAGGTGIFSYAAAWNITAFPTGAGSLTQIFGLSDNVSAGFGSFMNFAAVNDFAFFTADFQSTPIATVTNTLNTYHSMLNSCPTLATQIAYYDGVSVGSGTQSNIGVGNSDYQPLINSFNVGGSGQGNGIAGQVYYAAFWNRSLSADEAQQLHQDPYCFLIYPEDEIFATLRGGSGPTAYTLAGAEGAFVISGQAATTAAARKIAGAEGAFVISGQAAAMSHGYKIAGAEGSFVISGQAAAELRGIKLGGVEGSFSISGQSATLTLTTSGHFTLAGDEGSFTISGQAAALNRAAKIAGAEGSFSISGQVAGMLRGIKLGGNEGAFVISGQPATELRGIKLAGSEGAFVISGGAAVLSHGLHLAAAEGAFVISGQSAKFPVALSMKGAEGSFTINGPSAVLTYTPAGGGGVVPSHSNPFFATPGPGMALP